MTPSPRIVTLLPGDGIGPEITASVTSIVDAAGANLAWERHDAGEGSIKRAGMPLPPATLASIQRTGVCLKGPVGTPVGRGFKSVNVTLRQTLDLYANLRPVKNVPGVPARYGDLDLIVVRENTESLYSGVEHVVVPGVVESIKIITEKASTRIARFAFEYARAHGRRKVTIVHKANIMKLSDGLFLDCCRNVAAGYPDIEVNDVIVDAACMKLVMNPAQFDMLLLDNLYGDIVSDLAAGLVGGLGVTPGREPGREMRRLRVGARLGPRHRRQGDREPHGAPPLGRHDAPAPQGRGLGGARREGPLRGSRGRDGPDPGRRRNGDHEDVHPFGPLEALRDACPGSSS